MIIFNWLAKKNEKIKKFYDSYDQLGIAGKMLWWLMFVNWIPMVLSLALLLTSAVVLNFNEDSDGAYIFFWVSLGITALVFVPWIISGIVNSIKETKNIRP